MTNLPLKEGFPRACGTEPPQGIDKADTCQRHLLKLRGFEHHRKIGVRLEWHFLGHKRLLDKDIHSGHGRPTWSLIEETLSSSIDRGPTMWHAIGRTAL